MLIIEKNLQDLIVKQAIDELPNEACGILAGRDNCVKRVYPMINIDKSPATFFMNSKEQLEVFKGIRNKDLEMVGIYHSHIASQAYPSSHDVELAFYPEASYVIVSIKDKDKPIIRSFNIVEGRITEEELIIQ
jgi:proteasome lid subunit RPN8/RPN11